MRASSLFCFVLEECAYIYIYEVEMVVNSYKHIKIPCQKIDT